MAKKEYKVLSIDAWAEADGVWSLFCADEYEGPQRYRLILLTEY